MILDLETVMIASALLITLMATLFVADALTRPLDPVGRTWSLALLSGALSCYAFLGTTINELALGGTVLGTGMMVLAITSLWSGARRFSGRSGLLWVALAVPATCCVAVLLRWRADGAWAGAELMFAAIALFCLLTTGECLRRPMRKFRSSLTLALGSFLGGLFYVVRLAVLLVLGRHDDLFKIYFGTEMTTIVIMLLVVTAGTSMISIRGEESRHALFRGATLDDLTGAATPAALRIRARQLTEKFQQMTTVVSMVVVDLDGTTDINIVVGRANVDRALQRFVTVLREGWPSGTLIGREIGDRFCCMLTDLTATEVAEYAEVIRMRMESRPLLNSDPSLRMTASFGVSSSEVSGYDVESLISQATRAMQMVKASGGNAIQVIGDGVSTDQGAT